jgi:2-polyprenyl-3-methyl-5-hydroxy-6-metoxy-1,4-benzoquinol methylase
MTAADVAPVADATRFAFGTNWSAFLSVLSGERIAAAERSLKTMLAVPSLEGRTFLDVGSGSGLFSLAAVRLGAARVHSFDYDAQSVACTLELKRRFGSGADHWTIEQGSALDEQYIRRLGQWDVVYSWGVLHHTGDMKRALDLVSGAVAARGSLFIAIYNDQGIRSTMWRGIKRAYNRGRISRALTLATFVPYLAAGGAVRDVLRGRSPLARYRAHTRGMSPLHDWMDWLGGYPFEVARRDVITAFFAGRGFRLQRLASCGSKSGCNEFVFERCGSSF